MGNPLNSAEIDKEIARILDEALGSSGGSLRQLARESGVKLTRLGDVLRRNKAMTTGELDAIARSLGMRGSAIFQQAENLLDSDGISSANKSGRGNLSVVPDTFTNEEVRELELRSAALDPGYAPELEYDQPESDEPA